tara:strand:+ start:711 stop:1301 length:591 start_codon:yes stop_codon:yes gene_type:complete
MKTHKVIKQAISKELSDFIYLYFLQKRKVALYFFESKYISPFTQEWGRWDDKQVPNTYSHYADLVMETLLQQMKPLMEIETQTSLVETYSYARIYKNGDELKKHKDRPSCEISCTMNLGGDEWPIFLEGDKILLSPGDMLIYRGCDVEHWREPFTGNNCAQVFLHYNQRDGKFDENNKFDGRPFLGLPAWFKEDKI